MSEENLEQTEETVEPENVSEPESAATEESANAPRRKFFVILGIVLFVFALIGGYFYLERRRAAETPAAATEEEKPEAVVSVKVAQAEKQSIAQEFTAIGTVAP